MHAPVGVATGNWFQTLQMGAVKVSSVLNTKISSYTFEHLYCPVCVMAYERL